MNNSVRTNKVASLLTTLTAFLGIAIGTSGCVLDGTASVGVGVDTSVDTTPAVAAITIDPGVTMSSTPGSGVGLFAQYDRGGHWSLFTTCDTDVTGSACNFDVVVSADPGVLLDNVQGVELEPSDSVTLGTDGSINLVTDTSFGSDGITFDADPGATVEIDMLLDGVPQPRFVFVVSDGVLLDGVPSNPVDLLPAAP